MHIYIYTQVKMTDRCFVFISATRKVTIMKTEEKIKKIKDQISSLMSVFFSKEWKRKISFRDTIARKTGNTILQIFLSYVELINIVLIIY